MGLYDYNKRGRHEKHLSTVGGSEAEEKSILLDPLFQ